MQSVKKTIVNLSCTKQAIVLLKASEKREIRLLELAELQEAREARREDKQIIEEIELERLAYVKKYNL